MVNSGAALMARFYGLPSMCGGLSSDAKAVDAQAGFEKTATAIPLLLEDASIIYGVGATDAGSAISYAQMVMDDEIIAGLRRTMQGIALHDIDEEIALKLLKPDVAMDERVIERFRNELKFARKISHRHVCRMYDINEEEGTHFITMEYIPGEGLKSLIWRVGRLSASAAAFSPRGTWRTRAASKPARAAFAAAWRGFSPAFLTL